MGKENKCKSFKDLCVENNRIDLLDLFDYELNNFTPEDVSYGSSKKAYFKCSRGLHESREIMIGNVSKSILNGKHCIICKKCNSFGQMIVDQFGEDYLDDIWSSKNVQSPFDISKHGKDRIWLKCLNDETHPDYDLIANNSRVSIRCPYCAVKKLCYTNSFGYNYPDIAKYWSDKNEKTPFDYLKNTKELVWFKCENGIHDDYNMSINQIVSNVYMCKKCGLTKRIENIPRGENSPYWKGDKVDRDRRQRHNWRYDNWRKSVFEKDDYTCQCCGIRGGKLNAHHIKDFAQYEELRYDVDNGITLCANHHDSNISGGFHNLYGTHYKTPEELELYINEKRKQLGIQIPFSIDSYLNGNILKPQDILYTDDENWIFNNNSIDDLKNKIA